MASAARLPLKSMGFVLVIAAGATASRANFRKVIIDTFTGPGKYSRAAIALYLLLNLKSLPFVWNFRVFNGIYRHLYFTHPKIPPSRASSSLFLPTITTSRASPWECDYNVHKSNSTYFSDLDASRAHCVCVLFQPGFHKLANNDKYRIVLDPTTNKPAKGTFVFVLGAVSCHFKKEIKPFEPYEMWTRLLCWDKKWVYVVTHFVKKGAVKPKEYVLTNGSWFGGAEYKRMDGKAGVTAEIEEKYIYASAISKYVVKKGRLTVHPEVLLAASGLLPPKPGGWVTMDGSEVKTLEGKENGNASANGHMNSSASSTIGDWKWVEEQNANGYEYGSHFQALDGLHKEWTGSQQGALGKYRDLITV